MELLPPDIRKKLDAQDWDTIIERLTVYAWSRIRGLHWRGGPALLPRGTEGEDLAMQAIELVYRGERHWDPEKHPDLLGYLIGVVRSLVSHLVESKDNVLRVAADTGGEEDPLAAVPDAQALPDRILTAKETVQAVRDVVADDDELQLVLDSFSKGMRRSEIAEDLGLSLKEVDALLQRLRRKLRGVSKNE